MLNVRRVQWRNVTATHVLGQIKNRVTEVGAYLVFCDIPRHLPSGLKMKRFLKETGVVRPSNKAFAFRQQDEALEWVEAQQRTDALFEPDAPEPQDVERSINLPEMLAFADNDEAVLVALPQRLGLRLVKAGKKEFKFGASGTELYINLRGTVKRTVRPGTEESSQLAT